MAHFTRQAIIDSFLELLNERPFEKITVKDIIEKCGVSRNTFYYYFQDIYDLLDSIYQAEIEKLLNDPQKTETWAEAFLQVTAFARENKKAIYHIYKSVNHIYLEKYLTTALRCKVHGMIEDAAEEFDCDESDIEVLSEFYTSALLGTIFNWLNNDMNFDIESYINNLDRLIGGSIKEVLKKCAENKE